MTVPRPASEHARETLAAALSRVSDFVPLARYDDVLKPLERSVDALMSALAVVEQERDQLREAIASAMTSLATGPAKDGYAYSVLDAALAVPLSEPAGEPEA